jgi:hypothetical protein
VLIVWKNRLLISWSDEIERLIKTMMMRMMMKTRMMKIASMNIRNLLMIDRQNIEIFESVFDLLRFESNEICEMMI